MSLIFNEPIENWRNHLRVFDIDEKPWIRTISEETSSFEVNYSKSCENAMSQLLYSLEIMNSASNVYFEFQWKLLININFSNYAWSLQLNRWC